MSAVLAGGGPFGAAMLGPNGSNAAPTYSFSGFPSTGVYYDTGNNSLNIAQGGGLVARFNGSGVVLNSLPLSGITTITAGGNLTWTTDNSFDIGASGANRPRTAYLGTGVITPQVLNGTGGSLDLGANAAVVWRIQSAGNLLALTDNTVDIGASGANRPRNYIGAGYVQSGLVAVASLPAAAAALKGARHMVSDSSVAAAANFGAVVAGSGANIVPVYCDGTNWRIG